MNAKLFCYVIRVNKADSAFLYFTFEAMEGVSFYSTLETGHGVSRVIRFEGDISQKAAFEKTLNSLKNEIKLEILVNEEMEDGPTHDFNWDK